MQVTGSAAAAGGAMLVAVVNFQTSGWIPVLCRHWLYGAPPPRAHVCHQQCDVSCCAVLCYAVFQHAMPPPAVWVQPPQAGPCPLAPIIAACCAMPSLLSRWSSVYILLAVGHSHQLPHVGSLQPVVPSVHPACCGSQPSTPPRWISAVELKPV